LISPAQVFDILPARNTLLPSQSEDIEFTMVSVMDTKVAATAICVVVGGPEYKVSLTGESSVVGFELDRSVIDFHDIMFTARKDEELIITNVGKVIFDFNITGSQNAMGLFEINPSLGNVNPGEKQKIIFTVRPAMPCTIKETFTINIAHFEPITVDCYCVGIFPATVATLPRQKNTAPLNQYPEIGRPDTAATEGTGPLSRPVSPAGTRRMTPSRRMNERERDEEKIALALLWTDFQALAVKNVTLPDQSMLGKKPIHLK
jgi:hypothetical protein